MLFLSIIFAIYSGISFFVESTGFSRFIVAPVIAGANFFLCLVFPFLIWFELAMVAIQIYSKLKRSKSSGLRLQWISSIN